MSWVYEEEEANVVTVKFKQNDEEHEEHRRS